MATCGWCGGGGCIVCHGSGEEDPSPIQSMPGLRPEGRYLSLQERYEEWRATSDGEFVYRWVRREAVRLAQAGWKHYGMKTLWEAARYSRDVQVGPNAGFKLNNDFTSRMARELMEDLPDTLGGFFETRALKA